MFRVNSNVVITNNAGVNKVAKVMKVRYGSNKTYDLQTETGSELNRVSVDSANGTITIDSEATRVMRAGVRV